MKFYSLKLDKIVPDKVQSFIEYDEPALRCILICNSQEMSDTYSYAELVYWNLGHNNPFFSFCISLDKQTHRACIIELILYGDRIYEWPEFGCQNVETKNGVPVFDLDIFDNSDSNSLDIEHIFKIQMKQNNVRIEVKQSKVCLQNVVTDELVLEFDVNNELCGIALNQLPDEIINSMKKRYA